MIKFNESNALLNELVNTIIPRHNPNQKKTGKENKER